MLRLWEVATGRQRMYLDGRIMHSQKHRILTGRPNAAGDRQ